jgi:pyruvate formate lyase activating enzyme
VFLAGCPLRCAYCHNPDTWTQSAATETDAETLVRKIKRYKPYFKDNGGVTFSGGEPLLQAAFIREMIPLLRAEGIPYAVDTSGAVKLTDDVRHVLANAQTVLLDLKFWDSESYLRYTGRPWDDTLAMLEYLNEIGKSTWIRTVTVPGINDREEIIERYLQTVKNYACVERYELLGFHTMGFFKYRELGVENPLADTPPLETDRKNALQAFANKRLAELKA